MKNISGIIWDLDNTLYQFDEGFRVASQKALSEMILSLDIGMSFKEALFYSEQAYPMKTISKLNQDFGIDIDEAFFCYYNNLDVDFLKPSASFLDEIKKADVTFAILSHANRDWTIRALDKIGLLEFISPYLIMTIEDLSDKEKHKSTKSFEEILERMQLTAEQVVMVEDKDKNLKYARQLGIKTVLVNDIKFSLDNKHADITCKTSMEFMKIFNKKAKKNKNKRNSNSLRFKR